MKELTADPALPILRAMASDEPRQPGGHGCALVTGASRGIGAAIAYGLHRDGWAVGVNYRADAGGADAVVARIRADGGRAEAVRADVSDPDAIEGLFERLERDLGPVLVVVNNAGTAADDLLPMMDDDAWQAVIDTNLGGAFRITRRALGPMLRARFGRIVNVGSISGMRAVAGQANYAASKAGLEALTRVTAIEVARRGVTANVVTPGLIETQLSAGASVVPSMVPAQRPGVPDDVAACVRFLVSDAAGYVNGSTLVVDGGLTAAVATAI